MNNRVSMKVSLQLILYSPIDLLIENILNKQISRNLRLSLPVHIDQEALHLVWPVPYGTVCQMGEPSEHLKDQGVPVVGRERESE